MIIYITIGLAWTALFLFLVQTLKNNPSPEAQKAVGVVAQVVHDIGWFGLIFLNVMVWPFLIFALIVGTIKGLIK